MSLSSTVKLRAKVVTLLDMSMSTQPLPRMTAPVVVPGLMSPTSIVRSSFRTGASGLFSASGVRKSFASTSTSSSWWTVEIVGNGGGGM
eukprot:877665-Karenia_brevis.AAC.1